MCYTYRPSMLLEGGSSYVRKAETHLIGQISPKEPPSMIIPTIVQYFKKNCDSRGIPAIPNREWMQFIQQHTKDDIRDSLAEYIVVNNIPFPLKEITEHEFRNLFHTFSTRSMLPEYKDFPEVLERYDYRDKYSDMPLGVIDRSHAFNDISDYFQQENRMRCGSSCTDAPMDTWQNQALLAKMNWIFWRAGVMRDSDMDQQAFRAAFRLGTYTATQFKPTVAKALYEKHGAVNVLDTSCGWGDRLAGFYGTPSTQLYVGCDPNPAVFEVYKQQCMAYERLLGGSPILTESTDYFECVGKKTVKIWRKPSEDVDWSLYRDTFDFYFTSPPYFETEKYASDTEKTSDQSWARYDTFTAWKQDFFFKVTQQVWSCIKTDGYMMINIIEPRSRKGTRHNLCDDMVDTFNRFTDAHYLGKIGMRMAARPDAAELKKVFIEPVWVWRKGNPVYPQPEPVASLDSFFT